MPFAVCDEDSDTGNHRWLCGIPKKPANYRFCALSSNYHVCFLRCSRLCVSCWSTWCHLSLCCGDFWHPERDLTSLLKVLWKGLNLKNKKSTIWKWVLILFQPNKPWGSLIQRYFKILCYFSFLEADTSVFWEETNKITGYTECGQTTWNSLQALALHPSDKGLRVAASGEQVGHCPHKIISIHL